MVIHWENHNMENLDAESVLFLFANSSAIYLLSPRCHGAQLALSLAGR